MAHTIMEENAAMCTTGYGQNCWHCQKVCYSVLQADMVTAQQLCQLAVDDQILLCACVCGWCNSYT